MATIPQNIILLWPGTNAAIPSGWVRETSLDSKFIKGTANGVNPNVTGGADTHTHTSPNHTHTSNAHYHSGQTTRNGDYENDGGSNSDVARDAHVHDWSGTQIDAGSGYLVNAVTYAAGDSKPPYTDFIFIKPDGAPKALPADTIVLFNKTTVPTGWTKCDGTGGTPNLTDKFIRGTAAAGNALGTGGSLNHSHDVTHTHSNVSHTHAIGSGYDSDSGNRNKDTNPEGGPVCPRHTHTVYLAANTAEASSQYSGTAGTADTVQPLFKKLMAIKNTSGAFSKPRWIIGLWLGTLTSIPQGWWLCDGNHGTPDMRGYFLKITNTVGEIATTGGSNTHTHAASNSHNHTATGTHVHPSTGTSHVSEGGGTGASSNGASKGHSHSSNQSSAATSTWNATTITADSSNGEPAYRTVAFIMFDRELIGGVFNTLLNS
jgi:hypothetical protein